MKKITKSQLVSFLIIVASIVLVAGLGSLFSNMGMAWYDTLAKPSQYAPSIVFPIVWMIIYLAFAVVLCVWEKMRKIPKRTIILLIINGIFNVLWCLTYFTLEQTFVGLIVIILNLISAIFLWLEIYRNKRLYGYILAIYPLWLCLATALNLAVWILN